MKTKSHPINPMGIHLLNCVHGSEHIGSHDAICDTFVTIVSNVGFHVGWEQSHALPSTTFNSFCQWVDIVLTKDGIRILTNVVIANPTWTNLLLRPCPIQGFDVSNVAQTKAKSHRKWHPTDQFLPLAIQVFGCLYKHANMFLHHCANAIWSLKGLEGLHLLTLVTFICQKVSITLQKMQTSSILSRAIAGSLTTFRFSTFSKHTSHHNGQFLASHQFLTYKYGWSTTVG
jgi:hypothetical protein